MVNRDIRIRLMDTGVKQHQLGTAMGLTETRVSRLLKTEVSPEMKGEMLAIIDKLAQSQTQMH